MTSSDKKRFVRRKKTLQRLQNEERRVKERETKESAGVKVKMAASEERKERNQTVAAEEKKREQRRIDHLRGVRGKIDQREFEKCAASERKEIDHLVSAQFTDIYTDISLCTTGA